MNFILKILSVLAAMVAGSAITLFVLNKKEGGKLDCGVLLASNRKKLINKMNKEIDEIENRTSAKNHEKTQRELENMDWDSGACTA